MTIRQMLSRERVSWVRVRANTAPFEPNARAHYFAENLEKGGNIVLRARS